MDIKDTEEFKEKFGFPIFETKTLEMRVFEYILKDDVTFNELEFGAGVCEALPGMLTGIAIYFIGNAVMGKPDSAQAP